MDLEGMIEAVMSSTSKKILTTNISQ